MKLRNRTGSTLALTLMVFSVLMLLSTFVLNFMLTENKQSIDHQNRTKAYYIARGGAVAVEAAILNLDEDNLLKLEKNVINSVEVDISDINNLLNINNGSIKNVIIEKVPDSGSGHILITSTAKVNGIQNTVTKIMDGKQRIVKPDELKNVAIYAGDNLTIDSNPDLIGGSNIYVSENATVDYNSNKIEVKYKTLYFPPLKLDGIPKDNEIDFDYVPSTITTSTEPVIIVVDGDLDLKPLKVVGNGKVRIFVTGNLKMGANQNIGHQMNQIEIYCYGDILSITGNAEIYADIYVYKADNVVIGQSKFFGLIYAPTSNFTSDANHEHYGIIARNVVLKKNGKLNSPQAELDIQFDSGYLEPTKTTIAYNEGYYK